MMDFLYRVVLTVREIYKSLVPSLPTVIVGLNR